MQDQKTTIAISTSDCPKCGGRGYITWQDDLGYSYADKCECTKRQDRLNLIRRSGIGDLLGTCSFDNFEEQHPWQSEAKNKAILFTMDYAGKWFFIGGQVGAGKTHLCTAIVGALIDREIPARYMLWRNEMSNLRAVRFDEDEYNRQKDKWVYSPVLYIDDLYQGDAVDAFAMGATFEILNVRYNRKKDITILSSEKTVQELMTLDEAVGSRIYERSREYGINIPRDKRQNWRVYRGKS